MAVGSPKNKWSPFPCGGILDEAGSPVHVGGSALTDGINFTYTRDGAWGKRGGTLLSYTPNGTGPFTNTKPTGVRWYRAAPSNLTQLVVAAQGALWTGNDGTGKLSKIYTLQSNPLTPIRFTAAYDPACRNGAGGDILIICGASSNESFATDTIHITGAPSNSAGKILVTIGGFAVPDLNGSNAQTYSILQTDNIETIAQAVVDQINSCQLVQPPSPTLGQAFYTVTTNITNNVKNAVIHLGALNSGGGPNGTVVAVTLPVGSGTLAVAATNGQLLGGGAFFQGPLKYDGDTVSGLSYQITRPFRNGRTWHEHVWFWSDPNAINTLFATDIDQPEGFTFMNQLGGYKVGLGDGDPGISTCVPMGNVLAVYKTDNIYQIQGYDFQTGEYAFQISPWIRGFGVPTPDCVAEMENAHIIWTGKRFGRLYPGSYILEDIGQPIPKTSAAVHNGKQNIVRAVGGDFQYKAALDGNFFGSSSAPDENRPAKAFFVVDLDGDGTPDHVLVFDDEATQRLGKYAWMKWDNLPVAAWIPFGQGQNPAGTDTDDPFLFYIAHDDGGTPNIYRVGGQAKQDDGGVPIAWMAQTGYVTTGSFEIVKNLHRAFIELQATSDAQLAMTAVPGQTNIPGTSFSTQTITFAKAVAPAGGEAYNVLLGTFEPQSKTNAWIFQFSEDGTSAAGFELASYALDLIEETIMP